ncbi:hypothetical protein EYF80_049978 [Liparis tanakae]|uniref:Uncharacterized protein n=1 Tax=Liparis tanakae TaxID=230148 RepID=A0A4Z2FGJ5_9TELE|nr:hypothetical protein EYF80_049978 [Liparis tanakae]
MTPAAAAGPAALTFTCQSDFLCRPVRRGRGQVSGGERLLLKGLLVLGVNEATAPPINAIASPNPPPTPCCPGDGSDEQVSLIEADHILMGQRLQPGEVTP